MIEVELVKFGETEVPLPVSIGVVNELKAAAARLSKDIAEAAEFDAAPKRRQVRELEQAIVQLEERLRALEVEDEKAENADVPPGVFRGGTAYYYSNIDGITTLMCEGCWEPIPAYRDFPSGLIAADSDGDVGGNFVKKRRFNIEGKVGEWHPGKSVCLPCYLKSYRKMYPTAPLPDLDDTLRGGPRRPVKTALDAFQYIPEPKEPVPAEPVLIEPEA